MAFNTEAILKCPPYGSGSTALSGALHRVFISAIGAVSQSYQVMTSGTFPPTGGYFTWISDTDCYVNWGPFTNINSASASTSLFLPAGVFVDFWHRPLLEDGFSVIQKSGGGNITRWMSVL
jgi:hypothetical protein